MSTDKRMDTGNPLLPHLGRVVAVEDLAEEIKLFRVALQNGGGAAASGFKPGQFAFVSAFGAGEAPFGIANLPAAEKPVLEFAVARLGNVTTELHQLGAGDTVGVRGPLGNWFPMDEMRGKDLLVLGGGIGGAPLRPVIHHVLAHRADYGRLTIFWAARRPSLMVFRDELAAWREAANTELLITVDQAEPGWDGPTGLITTLLEKTAPSARNAVSITCGPPVMIHFVNKMLVEKFGFHPGQNYVTLEERMHCGIGKCGRCNLGEKLVCADGPVFTMAEVGTLLESYL